MRSSASARDAAPSSFACRCASARVGKCTCESVKPGRTQRPRRSTRSGLASAVSCVPTPPANHSPAIARLRASGNDGSIVRTTPFSRITARSVCGLDRGSRAKNHLPPLRPAEEERVATDWYMEGPYVKNCNCDPGCPCDFNQNPTHGHCEGMAGMRIDKGNFGDVDLSGLSWGAAYHWPGALHEGNGDIQPLIDEQASEEQRNALLQILSGQSGGTFFEVLAFVAPNVKEPLF